VDLVTPEILAGCRRGDRRASEELVRATYRRVYSLAVRLVGDRHDAEDVAQEAYLRMFRGLNGFREEARFETWMYRIVANAAMSMLKRRGRFGEILDEEDLDVPLPDMAADRAAHRDELERALASLSTGQRTVLWLKDVYGLSCREIGDELGIEEGAVKVRLHRARKRLRERLEEVDNDEVSGRPPPAPRARRRRAAG
jgi:RNA polymerase sigma-70 factor, ECF subfamily